MPKCKNSNTGTYKGTEPSPKGLGYCARGEKLGKKKKGRDGNMWEVKETKKGTPRWVKITKTEKSNKNISVSPKKKSVKKNSVKKKSETKKEATTKIKSKSIKKWDTKNIIIHKNNKIFKQDNELKISNNNLIYLIFGLDKKNKTGGRLYFGLKNLKGDKKEIIKDLKLDKKKQTFEFRYKGPWGNEDSKNGEIKVNDKWKVVFEDEKEFNKMESFVSQFDIVKIK